MNKTNTPAALTLCKTCKGKGLVSAGEITHSEGGIRYENGPVKCIKDCPDCPTPQPAASVASGGDFDLRGTLASKLICWHRLTVPEVDNLLEVFDPAIAQLQPRTLDAPVSEEMTAKELEKGWRKTFSTDNPFCPCDLKSFTKAVRWAEHTFAGRAVAQPAPVQIPEGWKPVPIELCDSVRDVLIDRAEKLGAGRCLLFAEIWADLLSAAPAPPKGEPS